MIINSLALRLLMPILAIELALQLEAQGLGILPQIPLPEFATFLISLVLLDLAIYIQHVIFHKVPFLWRFHQVHHADTGFDVTTGVRFHPGEIVFSMLYKLTIVLLLGPSAAAVLMFEVLLSSSSLFTHANASMLRKMDSFLRWFIVTPDMHRIHHSHQTDEALTNFGFNLSLWDRLFGTYRPDPTYDYIDMKIGTRNIPAKKASSIWDMLILPFFKN
jgi:sterol desaturase/sphingolipid hydroxylase (fatty acid hydroxylase superfamily)